MIKRKFAPYVLACLMACMLFGCAPEVWVKVFTGIASSPVLTPIEVIPKVSRDGKTFSVKATIANRGINDATGVPFKVMMYAIPDSELSSSPDNTNTITVPASIIIQGTAHSPGGNGGFYVTQEILTAVPWREGEFYNFFVNVDPNSEYFGGVAKPLNVSKFYSHRKVPQ